jgi:hypothetical protein
MVRLTCLYVPALGDSLARITVIQLRYPRMSGTENIAAKNCGEQGVNHCGQYLDQNTKSP